MQAITYPHSIQNCLGEQLTFLRIVQDEDGEKVIVENEVQPGCGPIMHTHWQQEESLTVVSGRMGYQILGEEAAFLEPGETALFRRGTPHRFWAEGDGVLRCQGWISPAHSVVPFLSAVYAAQNKSGTAEPDRFDGAWLLTRYRSEYDMPEIPGFVKAVIMPITVLLGKLLGRYRHFEGMPEPLPALG